MTVQFGAMIPVTHINGEKPKYSWVGSSSGQLNSIYKTLGEITATIHLRRGTPNHKDEKSALVRAIRTVDPEFKSDQDIMAIYKADTKYGTYEAPMLAAYLVTGEEYKKAKEGLRKAYEKGFDTIWKGGLDHLGLRNQFHNISIGNEAIEAIRKGENDAVDTLLADSAANITKPVNINTVPGYLNYARVTGINFVA